MVEEVILLPFDDYTALHRNQKAECISLKKVTGGWPGDLLEGKTKKFTKCVSN